MNKAGRLQLVACVPSALPYFFGGLRISSGSLIGAVVAEFVAGTGGAAPACL
jgi:NitT/TauT family transport system permease protein